MFTPRKAPSDSSPHDSLCLTVIWIVRNWIQLRDNSTHTSAILYSMEEMSFRLQRGRQEGIVPGERKGNCYRGLGISKFRYIMKNDKSLWNDAIMATFVWCEIFIGKHARLICAVCTGDTNHVCGAGVLLVNVPLILFIVSISNLFLSYLILLLIPYICLYCSF